MTTKGALIAAAVAGLFAAGTPVAAWAADTAVHCQGVNACKGKGWVEMSEKDCKAKGGMAAPAKK